MTDEYDELLRDRWVTITPSRSYPEERTTWTPDEIRKTWKDDPDCLVMQLLRTTEEQSAAIRKLREERLRLREAVAIQADELRALRSRVSALREENEALRADFEKYADHNYECGEELISQAFARAASKRKDPIDCTCGLDAARERWAKKETT